MQVITTHSGCDFDGLASLVAAGKLYPEAKLAFSGALSQEVRDFMHLYGWMIPVMKISEEDLPRIKKLILVDTKWSNRIGIFGKLIGKKQVEIHIYDHHPPHPEDIKGDKGLCLEVGATTSILVDLIKKRGCSLTPFEATLLALGIYEDTGSLSFSSTTSLDLRAVAFLLEKGARLEVVSNFLNRSLNEKQEKLLKDFLEKSQIKSINGVEVVVIIAEIDDFVGGLSLPLHKFIDLKNPDVTFAIIRARDKIYLMARSRNPSINVSEILSFLGGGGHNFAASALIKDKTIKEVEEELYRVLEKKIHPHPTAGQIMHSLVPVVFPEMSAGQVKKIMEEKNVEVLPVQKQKKIVGAITREKVEHIISYNSETASINSYYSSKFISVSPWLSLKKIQQLMMEEEIPWVFVFEEDKLVGVISSLDIFKAFHQVFPECSSDNLGELLKKRIPPKIFEILTEAGKIAQRMGFQVFIVGGFVRDLLLGNENLDIDLVVEGNGILYAQELARKLKARVILHRDFGTATLHIGEDFKLDIATSRREFYSRPAALPQVRPASLKEDLFRRDFTVNAMAISINPSDFGRLIDFFGGKKDLEARKVRVLHPKSFIDDPTRIFRAIRFEQRYAFTLEQTTESLLKQALKEDVFQYLSGKRMKEELIQILEEDRPEKNIRRMQELGVLRVIHPKIHLTSSQEKILDQLVDMMARYEVLTGKKTRRWLIRLSVLFEGLEKEEIENFCNRFTFTREERETLCTTSRKSREIVKKIKIPQMKPSSIYYLLRTYPVEALILAMARGEDELIKKRIMLYLTYLRKIELEIDGNDLRKMGYRPSPEFSRILEETKRAKLDGIIKTREEEIEFIRKNFVRGENQ